MTFLGLFELRIGIALVTLVLLRELAYYRNRFLLPPGYPFKCSADDAALEDTIRAYRYIVEDVCVTQDGVGADGTARPKCRRDDLCVVAYVGRGTYERIVSNLARPASWFRRDAGA